MKNVTLRPYLLVPVFALVGLGLPAASAATATYTVTEAPTGVPEGATSYPVSDFALSEASTGVITTGEYILTPASTSQVANPTASNGTFTGHTVVTAKGVTIAAVPATMVCPTSGGSSTLTVTPNSSGQYAICVVTASTSTTGPGSLTFTGLTYTPPAAAGPVAVTLSNQSALNSPSFSTTQPAITVLYNQRVAGTSADDTAASAAEAAEGNTALNKGQGGAAVLVSDTEYQDALAASFLGHAALAYQTIAGSGATTGTANMSGPVPILENPVAPPSGGENTSPAGTAIRKLGVSTVYIVGGTAVISDQVAQQLSQIQISSSNGTPQYLEVIRIAGTTAEETASKVAQYPTLASTQGVLPSTPGAYGQYNSGASESAAPSSTGNLKSAILADSAEFQDALAASPLAYSDAIPVLLNPSGGGLGPDAQSAIQNLKIQQVVVVGGSQAVSDAAVTSLESLGVSVLRIAGATFDLTAAHLAAFELNDYTASSSGSSQSVEGLNSPATNGGGSTITVGTSRGDAYQDALSSAQVLGTTAGDIDPLLLTADPSTLPAGTAATLGAYGTGPAGGLTVNSVSNGQSSSTVEHILGDIVFGGTLAQTPTLVTTELDDIAAG